MPPKKVTLLRQDGTKLDVSPEQAEKLKLLGYKEETPVEAVSRLGAEGVQEYYTSGEQQLYTGLEGAGRGLTAGATDYLFGDEETAKRVRYNPGIAAASEIGGAVASEFIPGLDVIAPTALIGRGARAVVRGEGILRGAARGALEGGVFGGAMAADRAYLDGSPVTSEAVLHGIGWGSLFGAGLGAGGAALEKTGAAKIEAGQALEAKGTAELAAIEKAKSVKPGAFAETMQPAWSDMANEAARAGKQLKISNETVETLFNQGRKELEELGLGVNPAEASVGEQVTRIAGMEKISQAFKPIEKELAKKVLNTEKLGELISKYEETINDVAVKSNLAGPDAVHLATGSAKQALQEYASAKIAAQALGKMPRSIEGFAGMRPDRAEELFAGLEQVKKLSNFPVAGKALEEQANKMQEALGLAPEGVAGLRKAWKQARESINAERASIRAAKIAEKTAAKEPGLLKRAAAEVAGDVVGGAVGFKTMSFGLGGAARRFVKSNILGKKTPELLAARNQTLGRIKQAVGKYQRGTGKLMSTVGPKLEPLAMRLDGSRDTSTTDKRDLAAARVREFASAAPHIRNTMYRAVEPIAVEQPQLGPALFDSAVNAFNVMRGMMPADPGVVSGLRPIWKPSQLQAEVMSRQLSVFHDPVSAAEEMLSTNIYDPIRVKALKEYAPQIYQQMRVEMIGRIQEPGFLDDMSYRDQVALGTLLDIPIHSSMKPEYIAASQAMHTNRNQPLPTPQIQQSTNGGRPAEANPGATQSQISTSR